MKTVLAFISAFSLMLSGMCDAADRKGLEKSLRIHLSAKEYGGSLLHQAKLDGVNYRKHLRGAIAEDDDSLSALFRYTHNGHLMGEGAEEHAEILLKLLRFWGDREFSRVLARESQKVRKFVVSYMDSSWPEGWKATQYPKTYRLGPHGG